MKALIAVMMFFAALFPGECQTYVDDSGRIMTACAVATQSTSCEVDFYTGITRASWAFDGQAVMEKGAQIAESWDLPAMSCGQYNGRPMVNLWSSRKSTVKFVYLATLTMSGGVK